MGCGGNGGATPGLPDLKQREGDMRTALLGLIAALILPSGLQSQSFVQARWQGIAVQAFAAPDSYCINGFQTTGPDGQGYVELVALASDGSSGAVLRARWQDVSVQPFAGGGCLTGFSVSGPDPQGFVTLTAHASGGASGDILTARWQGIAFQGYTAPAGAVIQAFFTGGPDPQGWVVLSADTVDAATDVEEDSRPEVVFGFAALPGVIRGRTTITFGLPADGNVRLDIYNPLGQRVKTLVSGVLPAGIHEVELRPGDVGRGMFFLRLVSEHNVVARKVILAGR